VAPLPLALAQVLAQVLVPAQVRVLGQEPVLVVLVVPVVPVVPVLVLEQVLVPGLGLDNR